MKNFRLLSLAAALLLAAGLSSLCQAQDGSCKGARSCKRGCYQSWNGAYYKVEWGMPVALVVPPTAENQTNYGWGVGNTRVTAICPQFTRDWPGPGQYNRCDFRPTPPWPSDTKQFGVYYVRGPW